MDRIQQVDALMRELNGDDAPIPDEVSLCIPCDRSYSIAMTLGFGTILLASTTYLLRDDWRWIRIWWSQF
jgi:hypothetical protein